MPVFCGCSFLATPLSVAEVRQGLENKTNMNLSRFVGSSAAFFLGQADIVRKNGQALKYVRLFSSHISKPSWLREHEALLLWNSYALFVNQ